MSAFRAALVTEFLKARRSRVPWGVAVGFSIAPLVMGLFMVILKDPERARALGLIGTKAQLTAGTADWPTYWSLLGQSLTVGGAILFAFLTAWTFGREFADPRFAVCSPAPPPGGRSSSRRRPSDLRAVSSRARFRSCSSRRSSSCRS